MPQVPPFPTPPATGDFSWLKYDCNYHGYITCSGCGADTPHYANDIQTPCGTSITALFDGTVSDAQCTAWGYQLFITMDSGMQYYYYHLKTINVGIGQYVKAGQFIGYSGGDPTDSNQSCVPSARWTTGCHTHVGFFTGFKNGRPYGPDITPAISSIRKQIGLPECSQSAQTSGSNNPFAGASAAVPQVVQNSYKVLTDTSAITDLFIFMDDVFQAINPFNVDVNYALGGIGGILDPVDWIVKVSLNIVQDIVAFTLRLTVFIVGVYILMKLVNQLINLTGKIQFGAKAVSSAAAIGLI